MIKSWTIYTYFTDDRTMKHGRVPRLSLPLPGKNDVCGAWLHLSETTINGLRKARLLLLRSATVLIIMNYDN